MISLTDNEFISLVSFMKNNYGVNLEKKRTLIEGRLTNYIVDKGFSSFSDYLQMLYADGSGNEQTQLVNFLTTNYSYFLREWDHFEFLRNKILPELRTHITDHDLRIWSAGCSSGEEPYTIAMVLADYFGADRASWDMKILATDISQRALEKARTGVYDAEALEKVPAEWRRRFFAKSGTDWEVRQALKDEVIFRTFNLMQEKFPFKRRFHVIFCRNVMIYFDKQTKATLIGKFYEQLEDGGYLIVGQSETVGRDESDFRYIMPSVFRKGRGA